MRTTLALSLFLAAPAFAQEAAPEATATDAVVGVTREMPANLPDRPFTMPEVQRGTLSNGLEVMVVTNREVPLWDARVVFRTGPDLDPVGLEGLASVTFDMMDEGVKGMDAAGLAKATKALGGDVGAGAGRDAGSVSVSGPTKNLEPLLDLWVKVLLTPTFPSSDWEIKQSQRIANLQAAMDDPNQIANRVFNKVVWGNDYTGRLSSEAAYASIGKGDMKKLYKTLVRPNNAVLLVGGDVSLEEIQPLLEARLARWKPGKSDWAPAAPTPSTFDKDVVYVVDKPGTAQAIVQVALPVVDRSDPTYADLYLANTAVGGAFTARVNMNLREDKGWTYGARCGISNTTGPSLFYCSTGVQIDQTVPSLLEVRKELTEAVTTRPVTQDELNFFSSYRVNSFYGGYETPGSLLGELQEIWTYGLPADSLEQWVPKLQAVTVDTANLALRKHLDPSRMAWFIVGDVAEFGDALRETGLTVITLDRDGAPVAEAAK